MRVPFDSQDFLSIERVEIDPQSFGIQLAGEVRQGGFTGKTTTWVQ